MALTLNGGLAITKSNRPDRVVRILVVGVRRDDLPAEAVDGQVHLGEPDRLLDPLLAEDRDLRGRVLLVLLHEPGRLDEHAARPAGGVEDAALERLDDVDDQLDDRGRGEELAASLTLGHGELAEEVLVDLPEGVTFDVVGDRPDQPQQLGQHRVVEAGVVAGQHTLEVGVLGLDGLHRPVQRRPDVGALGKAPQIREAGRLRHVHDSSGLVVGLADLAPPGRLAREFLLDLGEPHVGIAEEDQPEDRDSTATPPATSSPAAGPPPSTAGPPVPAASCFGHWRPSWSTASWACHLSDIGRVAHWA